MKTLTYTIATLVFGIGISLIAPIVSGEPSTDKQPPKPQSPVTLAQTAPPAPAKPAPPAPSLAALPVEKPLLPTPKIPKKDKHKKASDEFFNGPVRKLEFVWEAEEWEYLKRDNRRYAECDIIETLPDGTMKKHGKAAVKLKGAAGSFRGPDDKPGLTVNMDKYKGAERFNGMEKFHLNNGAQDGSFLNEIVGGDWCRASEVPASRCTHVLVKWNGRELGLYVFKESFTEDFLSYFYAKTDGSLYDGHFISEVDGDLELQQGDVKDRADLKALANACKIPDPAAKWAAMEKVLDVEQYLRFLALETFTAHWDGYNFNKNNYRVYFDPATGKANFFCHGMDQIFGDANWPVVRDPGSLVGQSVFTNPAWKKRYREIAEGIYSKVLKTRDWEARIAEQGKKITDALQKHDPQSAKDFQAQIAGAQQRVSARVAAIGKQFGDMPKSFDWKDNIAKIGSKQWRTEGAGTLDEAQLDGQRCFRIKASENNPASWRRNITLEPGKYRLEVTAKTNGIDAPGDDTILGAGLRISGTQRPPGLKGSTAWQKIGYDFESTGNDIVLVAELRATKGEVWFQADSFQILRVK